jgi:membrane-associated protease RseP (regulator of RpoE activity)
LVLSISRFGFAYEIMRLACGLGVLVMLMLSATVVQAQDQSPLPSAAEETGIGAGDAVVAPDEAKSPTITVTRAACKELLRHVPNDDVAYKPGVDVRGNKVTPADLNGGSNILNALPKEIEFPVTIDFFAYAGIAVPDGVGGEQSIGKITYRNGRIYFNDQPLGEGTDNAELIEACRKAGFR